MTLSALALLAAGCADSPIAPGTGEADGVDVFSHHTYDVGNTVKGYDAPAVETDVIDDAVELCAEWTDFSNFDPDDPKLYSFDIELYDGEEWVELGSAGGNGSPSGACFTTDPMEPGVHMFRVKGMALLPTGGTPPHSPQHTEYWTGDVVVGATLRFEALIRRTASDDFASSADLNANSGTWNFEFMLRVWDSGEGAFVDVTDCSEFPWEDLSTTVTWEGGELGALTFRDPECADSTDDADLEHALYKVRLQNPDSGAEGSGTLAFVFDGVENENDVTLTSTRPGGGGGGGGPQNK